LGEKLDNKKDFGVLSPKSFLLRMILLLIKPLFSAAGTPPSALFISTDYLAQKSFYGAFW